MALTANSSFLLAIGIALLFIATPVAAFGAGDIVDVAKIDGINYRHGDIENTLLELIITAGSRTKFDKLDVKRVYFGNWLRDYSQAIDVGGLKQLPAETIRVLLWALSFLTFGYATGEFEVTAERLGCYRPEEHIDNPKDYADNEDAREYDQRLRGPVDEGLELKVDEATGLKTYIASEGAGCETSAGMVRRLLEKSIELGRKHKEDGDKDAFYEALRLLGTSLHCLEDFSAHSNYTELALMELGVDAFPHVGTNTAIDIDGKKVFPLVTGTFGMTDFLASLVGELGDKVAQSEVEDMENKLNSAVDEDEKNDQTSVLKGILDNVPWDMLGGDDKPDSAKAEELKQAAAAKAEANRQNPTGPTEVGGVNIEEAKQNAEETLRAMYPILEFNDQVSKAVAKITSMVPGLDDLIENCSGALQIYTFSLLAPFIKPIIAQARLELKSSSQGVIKSSEAGQYEVFTNENSTDPTHSMLAKDHFSNILNPVAGQVACACVRFVVPQIVECWSDEGKDVRETIDNILQIFHHPALRDENREGQKAMFDTVKEWWESKDRSEQQKISGQLSFEGVKAGNNQEGEGAAGGCGHSHGAPKKKTSNEEGGAPSAQEGASAIEEIAGGLGGMLLGKLGISKPQVKQSNYGQSEDNENSYGSSGRKTQESSYGGENSSYGRQNAEEETSNYGNSGRRQQENSYGGGGNSSYGRQDAEGTSNYGNSGRQQQENSYGRSENTYGGGNTYGESEETQSSNYGRQQTPSRRNDEDEQENQGHGGFGGRRGNDDESEHRGSGFEGRGGRNEDGFEGRDSGFGGRRGNDGDESERRGQGGFGGDRRREHGSFGGRRGNDEDESERRNQGGFRGHGSDHEDRSQGGYGRRGNDEEESEHRGQGGYGRRGNDEEESEHRGQGGYRRRGGNEDEGSRY